jgi:uncharacterized protein (AIM24 family)
MSVKLSNFTNEDRRIVDSLGSFSVLEHYRDQSVAPSNAISEYYMSEMGVRRRQLVVDLDGRNTLVTQAGAMQWLFGDINATTGLKGVGDLFGKMVKGAVTKESAVKPEYVGTGRIVLEPTYKYIILQEVSDWGKNGMSIEDGMFLACEGSVEHKIASRTNFSSAIAGNEGLFNLSLRGKGVVALESNVPASEVITVDLDNDVLKLDGSFAICWSTSLQFTVERSSKTLLGSAVNGEGLVNVFRGTGRVMISPTAPNTGSLFRTTHD